MSKPMKAHLRRERRWLHVEPLPAYAPDLNPVETLWSKVKGRELVNLCAVADWPGRPAAPRWRNPSSPTPGSLCDLMLLYYANFSNVRPAYLCHRRMPESRPTVAYGPCEHREPMQWRF